MADQQPSAGSASQIKAIVQRLLDAGHEDLCRQVAQAQTLGAAGGGLAHNQEIPNLYQAIVDRCEHWLQHETTLQAEYRSVLALASANLGRYRALQGDFPQAIALERRAVGLCQELIQEGYLDLRSLLPFAQMELGLSLAKTGRADQAVELFEQARACGQTLLAEGQTACRAELALAHLNLGLGRARQAQEAVASGRPWREAVVAAHEDLSRAVVLFDQLVAEGQSQKRAALAGARIGLATVLYFQSRFEEAIAEFHRGLALFEQLLGEGQEELRREYSRAQAALEIAQEDYAASGKGSRQGPAPAKPWWKFW